MTVAHSELVLRMRTQWFAYLLATAITLLTLALRVSLGARIEGPMVILFTIPIILSAYWGSLGPGLLSTAISVLAAAYFLLVPFHSFEVQSPQQRGQLAVLIAIGIFISAITMSLHRSRERADQVIAKMKAVQADLGVALEEAQTSELRFRSLFEYAPDGLVIVDSENRYVDANASLSRMLGYSHEEIVGHQSIEFVSEKDAHRIGVSTTDPLRKLLANREWQFQRKDGTVFDTDVVVAMMPDGNRLAMLRDITERKRAQMALHENEDAVRALNATLEQRVADRTSQVETANKDLEAFSYSVSHDLRAPLRAMSGFAEMALQEFGPAIPAQAAHYLERIRSGGRQMSQLIDDLLAFSRLGRHPVNWKVIDSGRLVREVLQESAPQLETRAVEVCVGVLPPCHGDGALIKQVWVNLISNAIKYSRGRSPARIEIGSEEADGEIIYFVRDNGTGFDMQYAHKLFGVFQRLHRADEFEGTGVGLAIVERVIQRHGGRVWAEAEIDRGAIFRFTLPHEMPV